MMLLAVDIGNSNIVLGLSEDESWQHVWRLPTSQQKEEIDYATDISNFFLESGLKLAQIEQVVMSSVVPSVTPILKAVLRQLFDKEVLIIGPNLYSEISLAIDRPYEIGSDLVANAVAGYEKFKKACIVVDFGTALTFTTVSESGQILGVAIAPGLKTAMYSLFSNTAQLPEVPLELPKSAIGKNTTHALQAGVLLGYIGLAESLIKRIKEELNTECKVVATGGLSSILEPVKHLFDEIDPHLTLNGIKSMAFKAGVLRSEEHKSEK